MTARGKQPGHLIESSLESHLLGGIDGRTTIPADHVLKAINRVDQVLEGVALGVGGPAIRLFERAKRL